MRRMRAVGFLVGLALLSLNLNGQCKRLVKKTIPELAPFVFNGQLNNVVLTEGESAELYVVFQSDVEYRILTCGDKFFRYVRFVVKDEEGNIFFDSEQNENASSWDFQLTTTQTLIVQVSVPIDESGSSDMAYRGCVGVLIGYVD